MSTPRFELGDIWLGNLQSRVTARHVAADGAWSYTVQVYDATSRPGEPRRYLERRMSELELGRASGRVSSVTGDFHNGR